MGWDTLIYGGPIITGCRRGEDASVADYYINDRGAIYTAKRTLFREPDRRVAWVLSVWMSGPGIWCELPGERPYDTVEFANTRLHRLGGINRWRKLTEYEARKMQRLREVAV